MIICAYTLDRWGDLVASVNSVLQQTCAPAELILVIDHNPELLAHARDAFPDVTVIASEQAPGLSGARNTGLAHSNSKIVAFIDDDAMARATWLAELAAGYSAENVLGVGGFIAPLWERERPGWFPEEFDWVIGCTYRGMPQGATVRNLIGTNMSFKRDILTAAGGFSTELGRTRTQPLGAEEVGACIRASQLHPDGIFVYRAAAQVDHRVPQSRTSWKYFRQRCFAEGISKARLARSVGSHDALSSERHHAFVTLPAAFGRAVGSFFRGDRTGIARASALAMGLVFTGSGYVVGRLRDRHRPADSAPGPMAPTGESQGDTEPRRLKVLMITPRYPPLVGGVELHVARVAQLMAREADVTVLSTDTTGELTPSETVDGVNVLRVRAWPRRQDYYFAPDIFKTVREGDWDVIHIQSYHSAVAPFAMIAALRARIPFVLTFHGGGHSSQVRNKLRPMQWRVLRPLLARARKLIAVANFEVDQYSKALHVPRDRFVVIPNGSDLASITVEPERRKRSGGRHKILSIGRLERYKGHYRVIAAMPEVLREFPEAELRIIGSGPNEGELHRLVEELGLADKVTIGSIPASDRRAMAQALVWSSLVVLMSDFETHPLAIIEALQLGRPALVADTSGLKELAERGLAHSISLESTPHELAASIVEELRSPLSVQLVCPPTWDECAQDLLAVYDEVLGRTESFGTRESETTGQGA